MSCVTHHWRHRSRHASSIARANAGGSLRHMASRNVRPLFVDRAITLCGEPAADGRSAKLWAEDDTGAVALSATADFAV